MLLPPPPATSYDFAEKKQERSELIRLLNIYCNINTHSITDYRIFSLNSKLSLVSKEHTLFEAGEGDGERET